MRIFLLVAAVSIMTLSGFQSKEYIIDSLESKLDTASAKSSYPILNQLIWHTNQIDKKRAYSYVEKYDSTALFHKDSYHQARAKVLYGTIKYGERNFQDALANFLKASRIFEDLENTPMIGAMKTNISAIYWEMGDTLKTFDYLREAIFHYKKVDDSTKLRRLAQAYNNLGNTYQNIGQLDSAEYYLGQSIVTYRLGKYNDQLGQPIKTLGTVKMEQGKTEEALRLFDQAIEMLGDTKFAYSKAEAMYHRANLFLKENRLAEALIALNETQRYADKKEIVERKEELLALWSDYYSKIGDYKKALEYANKNHEVEVRLINSENEKTKRTLLTEYETEQKEQEIALLNSENEVKALQLSAANRRNIIFGIGLLAFGLVSFFLYRLYKKIEAQKEIISKSLNEKEILLKEIHHRVKNNLQVISSLLSLQGRQTNNPEIEAAIRESKDRVKSMSLIHQSLYQKDNLTGIEIKDYFEKLFRSLFDSYNIRREDVHLTMDIENLMLDVDTVIPIGLIVNELVSNALKHAFPDGKGVVQVKLKEENDSLLLQVIDNGIGIENAEDLPDSDSFGYKLIRSFRNKMKGELKIESENGTQISLIINRYSKVA